MQYELQTDLASFSGLPRGDASSARSAANLPLEAPANVERQVKVETRLGVSALCNHDFA